MKHLRFIPALLLILSACSENIIEQGPSGSGEMGSVSISLETDLRTDNATKAGEGELNVDDFRVAIYKMSNQMRLYNDSYANTVGREIKLNSGDYRLVAQLGDSTGCGFDKPYYMADPTFKVEGPKTPVEAVAKLSNVKLAVKYDASITDNPETYADYYTVVKRKVNGTDRIKKELSVKFSRTETRNAYIPAGDLYLEVYAKIDGVLKYYKTQPVTYNPNEFVTFTISTDASQGNLVINIKVDSTVENKDYDVEIPAITVPQDAPSITLAGFDGTDNSHSFVEGVNAGANAMASFLARGSIAHCYLTVESEYLSTAWGVSGEYDFANLTADQKAKLNAAGFTWDANMATSRKLSYIDFSNVIAKMLSSIKAEAQDVVVADFTLRVEDSVTKADETSFSIVSSAVNQAVAVLDYNVWAKMIKNPTVTADKGNMSLLKLQVSTDQKTWTDVAGTPVQNGNTLTYNAYEGTNPGTSYYFRSIYNNNPNSISPVLEVRTEDAAQVGNSGFEDYHMETIDFGSFNRNWYLPYASGDAGPWWACNSRASMKTSTTAGYKPYKNFPSSGYVTDAHTGSKAAMLFCVHVSNSNTDWTAVSGQIYEGEIWIGTADDSGNKATEGHAFASRPSKLSFWYKYDTKEGKTFYVNAWIKDAAGNVIATAQETAGQGASQWTRHSLDFNYSNLFAKAATIFINFSASYGDGSYTIDQSFTLGEENVSAHAGCFFKLDDIELIYE